MKNYGSDWGGYRLDPSKVAENSTIISVGIGPDCSFDAEVLKAFPTVNVICIDPTQTGINTMNQLKEVFPNRVTTIPKALAGHTTKEMKLGGAAVSMLTTQPMDRSYPTITLNEILAHQTNVSVIKMDIEGAEYEVIDGLSECNANQICIEWHHWLTNTMTVYDTLNRIKHIESLGYFEVERKTSETWRIIQESYFIKKSLLGL